MPLKVSFREQIGAFLHDMGEKSTLGDFFPLSVERLHTIQFLKSAY